MAADKGILFHFTFFIIYAKLLATKLSQNKNIKGIEIHLKDYKISQFADDTTVILDGSDASLNHTLEKLEKKNSKV